MLALLDCATRHTLYYLRKEQIWKKTTRPWSLLYFQQNRQFLTAGLLFSFFYFHKYTSSSWLSTFLNFLVSTPVPLMLKILQWVSAEFQSSICSGHWVQENVELHSLWRQSHFLQGILHKHRVRNNLIIPPSDSCTWTDNNCSHIL